MFSPGGSFRLEDEMDDIFDASFEDGDGLVDFLGDERGGGGDRGDVLEAFLEDSEDGGIDLPPMPPPAASPCELVACPPASSEAAEALALQPCAGPSSATVVAPTEVSGSVRFATWVRSLSGDALVEASASPQQWVAAARQQELSEQPALKAARKMQAERQKGKRTPSRLAERLQDGAHV